MPSSSDSTIGYQAWIGHTGSIRTKAALSVCTCRETLGKRHYGWRANPLIWDQSWVNTSATLGSGPGLQLTKHGYWDVSLVANKSTSRGPHSWLIAPNRTVLSCLSVLSVRWHERKSAMIFSSSGRYWAETVIPLLRHHSHRELTSLSTVADLVPHIWFRYVTTVIFIRMVWTLAGSFTKDLMHLQGIDMNGPFPLETSIPRENSTGVCMLPILSEMHRSTSSGGGSKTFRPFQIGMRWTHHERSSLASWGSAIW